MVQEIQPILETMDYILQLEMNYEKSFVLMNLVMFVLEKMPINKQKEVVISY